MTSSVGSTGGEGAPSIRVLGIESTAHTFSCSVVEGDGAGARILSDVRSLYKPPEGSGIHPGEAARHHWREAPKVLRESLSSSGYSVLQLNAIAFSMGPGLGPCLRTGAVVARSLALNFRKPLIPVNHAVAHIELARMLTSALQPVVLLVSGGHTAITALSHGAWRVFGETLDITVGQLVDQLGRSMGYASPCGREVEELAGKSQSYLELPYVVKGNDVSFSGILTAAKRMLAKGYPRYDVCFSVQETAFAMLCEVVERALAFTERGEVLMTGGVAANKRLREMMGHAANRQGAKLHLVEPKYTADCGAQIAWTGLLGYRYGLSMPVEESTVRQSWRLDEVGIPWS